MSPITGDATERLRKELKELMKGYKVVKCYLIKDNTKSRINCDELPNLLDDVSNGSASIEVCNESIEKCINVAKDDKVIIVPIEGKEIYFNVRECELVNKDQRIGYIITGKGEVRTIRSPEKGYIVLIKEELGEKFSRYKLLIKVGTHE